MGRGCWCEDPSAVRKNNLLISKLPTNFDSAEIQRQVENARYLVPILIRLWAPINARPFLYCSRKISPVSSGVGFNKLPRSLISLIRQLIMMLSGCQKRPASHPVYPLFLNFARQTMVNRIIRANWRPRMLSTISRVYMEHQNGGNEWGNFSSHYSAASAPTFVVLPFPPFFGFYFILISQMDLLHYQSLFCFPSYLSSFSTRSWHRVQPRLISIQSE